MKYKEYISVDIETTGLVEDHTQILQLAAVYEDFITPLNELEKFNVIIDNGDHIQGGVYALVLNSWILQLILDNRRGKATPIPVVTIEEARAGFRRFILECQFKRDGEALRQKRDKFQAGGKNFSAFDAILLKKEGFDLSNFMHRTIDPGSLYFHQFGYNPSLDEISKFLQLPAVTHDALDDALRVIEVVRIHKEEEEIRNGIIENYNTLDK